MKCTGKLLNLSQAAKKASRRLHLRITEVDLAALIDIGLLPTYRADGATRVREADVIRFGAQFRPHIEIHGLFTDVLRLISDVGSEQRHTCQVPGEPDKIASTVVFLTIAAGLGLSFARTSVDVERIQLLLSTLRDGSDVWATSDRESALYRLDLDHQVTIWAVRPLKDSWLRERWADITSEGSATAFAEALVTPRIYGNKSRLTQFIVAVTKRYVPPGSAVCDLMSGSGIVTQKLAASYDVYANDANPFAALLTRCQAIHLSDFDVQHFIDCMKPHYERNATALRKLFSEELLHEAHFLKGRVEPSTLAAYRAFCEHSPKAYGPMMPTAAVQTTSRSLDLSLDPLPGLEDQLSRIVAERRRQPTLFPFCLVSTYFANAYFGLAQSIAIDSIRFAIEQCATLETKDFFLGGLLLAAFSCSSGPHFAQPPKLTSERAMRELVEHRSRDVSDEFLMLVHMLQHRRLRQDAIKAVWRGDWREALRKFVNETHDRPANARAVYIDPPYSKLQYSRYYHALNTLLDYHYPVSAGVGRYPPRMSRFSSKFEYQRAPALRELGELCAACAGAGLTTILSYSSRGLISVPEILEMMDKMFSRVDVFTKAIRHHSQGVVLERGRQNVTEYLIVGSLTQN